MSSEILDAELVGPGDGLVPVESRVPANLFNADSPAEVITKAADVATALKDVLRDRKLTSNIQGKEHVSVEGWTLLGSLLGVFPVVEWTRKTDDGWEARVEARTRSGEVVGAAEASCGRAEKRWGKADDYAIRSMAQTRATSKALRLPLGFVVSMAGYEATPVEELSEPATAGTGPTPASTPVVADSSAEVASDKGKVAGADADTGGEDESSPPTCPPHEFVPGPNPKFHVCSKCLKGEKVDA